MSAERNPGRLPEEEYLEEALRSGRARLHSDFSMKVVTIDPSLQARCPKGLRGPWKYLDGEHVQRLGRILSTHGALSPVIIFYDEDSDTYYLADGFHRWKAYLNASFAAIQAHVIRGTRRDALGYATMCNRLSTLARTKADEKRAACLLFADEHWAKVNSTVIANHVGVTPGSVTKWRVEYYDQHGITPPKSYISSNGIERPASNPAVAPKKLFPDDPGERIAEYESRKKKYEELSSALKYAKGGGKDFVQKKINDLEFSYLEGTGAMMEKYAEEKNGERDEADAGTVRKMLLGQQIASRPASLSSSAFGAATVAKNTIIVVPRSMEESHLREAIFRAVLNRDEFFPKTRAIVVCDKIPIRQIVSLAKWRYRVDFVELDKLCKVLMESHNEATDESEEEIA